MNPALAELLKFAGLAISPFIGIVPVAVELAGDSLINFAASEDLELFGMGGAGLHRRFFNKLGQPNHHLNRALQLAILDALQEIDIEKVVRALRSGKHSLVLPVAYNPGLIRFIEDATEENFQQLAKGYTAAAFPGFPQVVPELLFRRLHSAVAARFWDRVKNDASTWHAYATEIFGEMRDSISRIEGKRDQFLALLTERETLVLRTSSPAEVSSDLLAAIENQSEKWHVETHRIRQQLQDDSLLQQNREDLQPDDTDKELADLQSNLEEAEKLLATNPQHAEAARDVCANLDSLGLLLLIRRRQPGDAETALSHVERSLEIREKLLTANPDSTQAARDVAVSATRLGIFIVHLGQAGDAEKAFPHYQRSLEIREKLLITNPDSAEASRDVSGSLVNLGNFLADRGQPGDAEQALAHYQRSLEIREKLRTAYPNDDQVARDVSVSLNKLGDFLADRGLPGDAEQTLAHYQRSLELREKILTANLDSTQAASDVSVSLNNVGDFLTRRRQPGDIKSALPLYQRDLELNEMLYNANPDSAGAARELVVAHYKLAVFTRGDAVGKTEHRRSCHDILAKHIARGVKFDQPNMELFERLKQEFGK